MNQVRRERGRKARGEGRFAEVLAALLLMAKGYRILGFRLASRQGEIDILALRGKVLAAVEVKRRATIAAAIEAVYPAQRDRIRRAAERVAATRGALAGVDVRLDLIALAPGQWPRHIPDAWQGG
jgi:putative endonuclease